MFIITLTTIPSRFSKIGETLESLLAQRAQAETIQLYIPAAYRRFPDWDGQLPSVPKGIEICRTEDDLGPATKVLPAAYRYAQEDVNLLFCDDDQTYSRNWTKDFLETRAQRPNDIIASLGFHTHAEFGGSTDRLDHPRALRRWRATDFRYHLHNKWVQLQKIAFNLERSPAVRRVFKRSGYVDVFEGRGGVMVKPAHFGKLAANIPPVLWAVDDVWLSGMATQAGHKIWLTANTLDPMPTSIEQTDGLARQVLDGANRHQANQAAIDYMRKNFGIWN